MSRRLPRGMRPIVFGESVINYAQLMLADLDNLRKQLVAQGAGGCFRTACGDWQCRSIYAAATRNRKGPASFEAGPCIALVRKNGGCRR